MSIRDLFNKNQSNLLPSASLRQVGNEVESPRLVEENLIDRERTVPRVDFSQLSNFCKFASGERYYRDVIDKILKSYPYDGSFAEKQKWRNGSTFFENYFLDNEYPHSTGYARIGANYGTILDDEDDYTLTDNVEYISFRGVMNTGSKPQSGVKGLFGSSNKYDPSVGRDTNLLIGLDGVTLEFWLKKDLINVASGSSREVIFDLWNSEAPAGPTYGRFRLEMNPGIVGNENRFHIEFMSGSAGVSSSYIGIDLPLTGSEWNHYAVSVKNVDSSLRIRTYLNGRINHETNTGTAIQRVEGGMFGALGALVGPSGSANIGWGKMSAAIDEVRFWKTERTEKQIALNWFTQVGGGSNTDDANVDLGLYYKFNEGTSSTTSLDPNDSVVLDYSGRVTNGRWIGNTVSSRISGSAMVESGAALAEKEDPIMFANNPLVLSLRQEKTETGREFDERNNASLVNKVPGWMLDEDSGGLSDILQIMGSYFDTLYLSISELPRLKDVIYLDKKPLPFTNMLLDNAGFGVGDILSSVSALESVLNRSETKEYEKKISEVRNLILQNIYNNLPFIYRSKGTEKSIRNMMRCFGIDDEILTLNMYADNVDYTFDDRYRYTNVRKKHVDFNHPDRFDSVVYQMTSSSPTSTSYIPGDINKGYTGTTIEFGCLFPRKFEKDSPLFFRTDFVSSSLFGMHAANTSSIGDTTWHGSDAADLRVYAVRPEQESKDAYFLLTSSYLGVHLTSSLYHEVYDNERWNLSVKFYHEKYPLADGYVGSSVGDYKIDFQGINTSLDTIQNEFKISETVPSSLAEDHFSAAKRLYVGAHRNNFTGSLVVATGDTDEFCDVKVSSLRYWLTVLEDEVLREHAKDVLAYGAKNPHRGLAAYRNLALNGISVPENKSLALHWDFQTVVSSSNGSGLPPLNQSDGTFVVEDLSKIDSSVAQEYAWVGVLAGREHTGKGDFFLRNDTKVVDRMYTHTAERLLPENLSNMDMTQVLTQDDTVYAKDATPVNYHFQLEKSMYQIISKDMLKMLGTVRAFNDIVGDPINRYSQEYLDLRVLRQAYFSEVINQPDLHKFFDFYKWIDDAVSQMVAQLIPASGEFQNNFIANIIESHIFERNKYWNKLPTLELKQEPPQVAAKSINELKYNWKTGHAPISGLQSDNCEWWRERAERTVALGQDLNSDRANILSSTTQALNRKFTTVYDSGGDIVYLQTPVRSIQALKSIVKFGSEGYLVIDSDDITQDRDCND